MILPPLPELRKIAEAATPTWDVYERNSGSILFELEIRHGNGVMFRSTSYGKMAEDAKHIATFNPETVLSLLDRIEALESELALARERLGPAGIAMLKYLQRLRNKEEKK